eukprot:12248-Heterococcus_DN1.PRE.9
MPTRTLQQIPAVTFMGDHRPCPSTALAFQVQRTVQTLWVLTAWNRQPAHGISTGGSPTTATDNHSCTQTCTRIIGNIVRFAAKRKCGASV